MKTIILRHAFAVAFALALCCTGARFAAGQEPLDGPNRIFKDELLENLVGDWKLSRKIFGRSVENTVKVRVGVESPVSQDSQERRRNAGAV